MATQSVCSCFGNLRPRYKRLVDKIYPSNAEMGLVNSNMEKLTFYTLSAPEKLDRIGDYIYSKLSNYLYRKKTGFVLISIQAMDHLLLACRSSSLNMFVESFLRMVNTLLESSQPDLQIAATSSFTKFANIEEDTPSYHRRYDFFVSKFSEMCWSSDQDGDTGKNRIASGIKGLQGVVRKTVKDDLQVNIWDDVHMGKIIPSLLFNIDVQAGQKRKLTGSVEALSTARDEHLGNPEYLAESCLREIFSRATFGNITAALKPIFDYLDSRDLWIPNDFATHCFVLVMHSIQNQYSYKVIESLLNHLDSKSSVDPKMKASITEVISAAVSVPSGGSIGPSVLEVFNTLLKHLRMSIEVEDRRDAMFVKAIIATAGNFSQALPGYQRIEVMTFIAAKIPGLDMSGPRRRSANLSSTEDLQFHQSGESDVSLQMQMFHVLLAVAEKHMNMPFQSTLPSSLLDFLLKGLVQRPKEIRLLALKVFENLLDRHENSRKIESLMEKISEVESDIEYTIDRCTKQDSMFIKKHAQQMFFYLYQTAKVANNSLQHYRSISNVICLLALEFGEAEVIVEIAGFMFGLQDLARKEETDLSLEQKCAIHAVVSMTLRIICDLTSIGDLKQHFLQVMCRRKEHYEFLMPSVIFNDEASIDPKHRLSDFAYFDRHLMINTLKMSGYDTSAIDIPYHPSPIQARTSSVASFADSLPMLRADSSGNVASIPSMMETKKITFEDLKNTLRSTEKKSPADTDFNIQKATFEEIAKHADSIHSDSHARLNRILETACRSTGPRKPDDLGNDLFTIKFPSLYIY